MVAAPHHEQQLGNAHRQQSTATLPERFIVLLQRYQKSGSRCDTDEARVGILWFHVALDRLVLQINPRRILSERKVMWQFHARLANLQMSNRMLTRLVLTIIMIAFRLLLGLDRYHDFLAPMVALGRG